MSENAKLSFILKLLHTNNLQYTEYVAKYITKIIHILNQKDAYTASHSLNVGRYAYEVAVKMKLSKDEQLKIAIAGVLHDIGKLFIPDYILKKQSPLTTEEFGLIKSHSYIGYEVTKSSEELLSLGIPELILYHHERIDGTGYPNGVNGDRIPIGARIISVADSYDAMTTNRCYRKGFDHQSAIKELSSHSDSQFDQHVIYSILMFFKESLNSKVIYF